MSPESLTWESEGRLRILLCGCPCHVSHGFNQPIQHLSKNRFSMSTNINRLLASLLFAHVLRFFVASLHVAPHVRCPWGFAGDWGWEDSPCPGAECEMKVSEGSTPPL